ncbi:MAG: hypothetical protein LBH93_08380 [Chitinispirillales bacterium]|jgi:uncharacterized spore protein YtfJ|nr:hypothetical protein [Chitinispirillales bacterium]
MPLSDVINTALDHMHHIAKTETVFGDPLKVGGITIVPVSKVSIGFAAGGGGKDDKGGSGAGTGGGVNVTPVALISISGDGAVKVHPLDGDNPADIGKLLAAAPDAVKKVMKFFKKKDGKDGGGDGDGDVYGDGGVAAE